MVQNIYRFSRRTRRLLVGEQGDVPGWVLSG